MLSRLPLHLPTLSSPSASVCLSSNIVRRLHTNMLFTYQPIPGEKLLYCVERYGVIIVVGQTGCGKTTRVFSRPLYL
jgi:type II secretory ATPase GspE/PulE/Tfp pilus assembly ATPase PilB-like protein